MGMGMSFYAVPMDQLLSIAKFGEDELDEFLHPDDLERPTLMYIDKFWDGLGFVFQAATGLSEELIFGAQEFQPDVDWGNPLYWLSALDVQNAHQALSALSTQELLSHYDAKAMMKEDLYMSPWYADAPHCKDVIADYFIDLKKFYEYASRHDLAVLTYLV